MPYYQCQLYHKCKLWNFATCIFKKEDYDMVADMFKEEFIRMVRLNLCTEDVKDIIHSLVLNINDI